ncbi:MAG TPA: hypothetical protein VMS55_17070 [Myxococcota bacterium]|nr:hypothetical protein [Myxococcota bacterium]
MEPAIVGALAGVLGSVVTGSATVAMSWVQQTSLTKRELLRIEITKREALYGEFILECSKLAIDAFGHTLKEPEKLLSAYALLNRIRVSASDAVLREADNVIRKVTEQYFSPNLSIEEIHVLVRSGRADPIKSFGEACRIELRSLRPS